MDQPANDYQPTAEDVTRARATAEHFRTWAAPYVGMAGDYGDAAERALAAAAHGDATADRMERTLRGS